MDRNEKIEPVKKWHQTATYRGNRYFPIDMLRYDSCWPRSPGDVSNIALTFSPEFHNDTLTICVARIAARKSDAWTDDRWKTFGWVRVQEEDCLDPLLEATKVISCLKAT